MLGSKNRDFKTSARSASVALDWHNTRMLALMKTGLEKEVASKQAYDEWCAKPAKEVASLFRKWRKEKW